jgi:hypothetical protein
VHISLILKRIKKKSYDDELSEESYPFWEFSFKGIKIRVDGILSKHAAARLIQREVIYLERTLK